QISQHPDLMLETRAGEVATKRFVDATVEADPHLRPGGVLDLLHAGADRLRAVIRLASARWRVQPSANGVSELQVCHESNFSLRMAFRLLSWPAFFRAVVDAKHLLVRTFLWPNSNWNTSGSMVTRRLLTFGPRQRSSMAIPPSSPWRICRRGA